MKKKIYFTTLIIILFYFVNNCGYTPIFSSKNLNIKINDYYISGDAQLGEKIYSTVQQLLLTTENSKGIDLYITSTKDKSVTSQSTSGKTLEYKITLITDITITDSISGDKLLEESNTLSQNFKVQDQIYETERIENKTMSDLTYRMSQELLIKISQINL